MHIKRAWHLLVFIGIFEVLDYLSYPITTYKPTPFDGRCCFVWVRTSKVSKFQRFQSLVNFAIFYSVMCMSIFCFLHHRHSIWFYYPFCILLLLTPYCRFYCTKGGKNLAMSHCELHFFRPQTNNILSIEKKVVFLQIERKLLNNGIEGR